MAALPEYDIIFAGGGTAACLIAGRLAKANPDLKILIIEAGEHTLNNPLHVQPARYPFHLLPESKTVTFQISQPSPSVNNRSVIVPCGRCLGGGSSVNFLMYTRAAASDYDDWETVYGNPGWGSKDLLPLLKKSETYEMEPDQPTHGYSGPLSVSKGGLFTNIGESFLEAASAFDDTRKTVDDINNLHAGNAYGRWAKWINGKTGRRSDVPHHFIYNQSDNKNLQVVTGAKVKRVIFEGDRAVGVEYVTDTTIRPDADQTIKIARSARIVVSAGAFGSPAILERSGIGGAKLLEEYDIPVKVDLPGVGENYQDHNMVFVPCYTTDEAETLDPFLQGQPGEEEKLLKIWNETGKGLLAHNGVDTGSKLRPNQEELKEIGPDFAARWKSYYEKAEDKAVLWVGLINYFFAYPRGLPPQKFYIVAAYTEHPASKGHVHITSKEDPHKALNFQTGYLTDPGDVALLRWGFKRAREISRRMSFFRGEYILLRPGFGKDSNAACVEKAPGPVSPDTPPISYTKEEDHLIDEWVRDNVTTTWHSCGTCAMKPREQGGVVDSKLNVYGVQGLKVADLSIMPGNVAANTYSTALVVAEKAALIIAEEMGLKLD